MYPKRKAGKRMIKSFGRLINLKFDSLQNFMNEYSPSIEEIKHINDYYTLTSI